MRKKVSLITLFLSCLFAAGGTFVLTSTFEKKKDAVKYINTAPPCTVDMDMIRLGYYKYSKPLLFANVYNENPSLNSLRLKIENYILESKSRGELEDISVYFRKMNNGSYFTINPDRGFNPASMSKVTFLICYLKEAEKNPSLLDKKVYFEKHFSEGYQQNIKDFELKQKSYYSIRDLLGYMIKYSDNDATVLIIQNLNKTMYRRMFSDFKIPEPPETGEYEISAIDFSKFFRALYNSTYLSPELSEFALKMLTTSTYKEGILKGINFEVEVAHKFGERVLGDKVQLHEFGIVYNNDGEPYMLGVMTKGRDLKSLSKVIADISRISYSEYRFLSQS